MVRSSLFFLACLLSLFSFVHSQAPRPNGASNFAALQPIPRGGLIEQNRGRRRCGTFRELDGVCTNNFFTLWGSTNRAQSSLFFRATSTTPNGQGLKSAREISNILFKQSSDMFNNRKMSEMVTFFGQFIDHTVVATPTSDTKFNIPIPRDDPAFANFSGSFLLRRSKREKVDVLGLYGSAPAGEAATIPFIVQADPQLRGPGVAATLPPITANDVQNTFRQLRRPTFNRPTPPPSLNRPGSLRPNFSPNIAAQGPGQTPGTPGAPSTAGLVPPATATSPQASTFRRNINTLENLERPSNSLPSALDLVTVYGPDKERADALRSFSGGKLKVIKDNLLPLNDPALNNAPVPNKDYFLAGDHRANEHPVLLSIHTIWVREHNRLCDVVSKYVSGDEKIYQYARAFNIAQFQKILVQEWYPAITGRRLPRYRGFRFFRNPNVIDIFSTAAFRIGHTMVGNKVTREGPGNTPLPDFTLRDVFFPLASKTISRPSRIEEVIRGACNTKAQEIDLRVHDMLRNGLFQGIPEEGMFFDLMALNIQRGRDHALPTYAEIRARFGLGTIRSFSDITKNGGIQSSLQTAYASADKVEAWPGLLAEDKAPGSSMGRTMLAIWERQFTNMRDGDRLWYENQAFLRGFDGRKMKRLPEYRALFRGGNLWTDIVLRNTDITASELPRNIFTK